MENKISKSVTFLSVFIFSVASVYLGAITLCVWLLAAGVILAWHKNLISRRFALVLMMVFLLGVLYTDFRTPKEDGLQKYILKDTEISGVVTTIPKYSNGKIKFHLDVQRISSAKESSSKLGTTAVSIFSDSKSEFTVGDELKLSGRFSAPYGAKNFGQFDYANYLKNQGIFTVFYAKKYAVSGQSHDLFLRTQAFFDGLTRKIIQKQSKYLSKDQSDLLGGIVFGHKSVELDDNIEQNFINSGVFHVLAASGMQIGLVLFFWYFLTRFLGVPYVFSMLSGAFLIVIYAGFTGFPPSILRALLMAEFIIFGKLIDRQADNIALLLLVCSIMLIYSPLSIMDIGFQLSFITTFGLLFCMPKFLEKIKFLPDFVSGTILMTVVAQLFASPLTIYYFNNLSLYSLFANIFIIPFVSLITFAGFASSFVALIPHTDLVIRFSSLILAPLLTGMNFIAAFFAHLPESLIFVKQISILSVIVAYIAIISLILAVNNAFKNKVLGAIGIFSVILFLSLNINFSPQKSLEIVFFDVGNSDAILVKLPTGKQFLVDTGKANPYGASSGKTVITEYLKATGQKDLEAIILTHPDADHIGGCCDILNFAKVNKVYENCSKGNSCVYDDLQKYLSVHKIPVNRLQGGKSLDLMLDNSVKIKLIEPCSGDKNEGSIVTFIEYGDFRALLLGDNEKEVVKFLDGKIKTPITVLKLGHHGSRGSVDEEMLKKLSPQNVVISVGKNNFGHPDSEVLETLKKHGVKTYRTDWDNMLLFSCKEGDVKVKRYVSWTKKVE